jgi:hypothetical protein
VSGKPVIPSGAIVIRIRAHATSAGSISIPNGVNNPQNVIVIPLPASASWFEYESLHLGFVLGANDSITFSTTDSYLVECYQPSGAT